MLHIVLLVRFTGAVARAGNKRQSLPLPTHATVDGVGGGFGGVGAYIGYVEGSLVGERQVEAEVHLERVSWRGGGGGGKGL